jgi:SAM-dependent methyltransferase
MGKAEWGADPEFFGPRHAHREDRLERAIRQRVAPGRLHLECAAGVGSLSITLARTGTTVVAADMSLRSLAVVAHRAAAAGVGAAVLPVVADITNLPFPDQTFPSASSAETLEHIPADIAATQELARVLTSGGWLCGTVPADPGQWSDWDDWGGHLRRYEKPGMTAMLSAAGLEPEVTIWGWPMLRIYDDVFMQRVNRRRLHNPGSLDEDPALAKVADLGRKRWLVNLVRSAFSIDRLFDGAPWGVGLLFRARKPTN